jgi:hypothetical protein
MFKTTLVTFNSGSIKWFCRCLQAGISQTAVCVILFCLWYAWYARSLWPYVMCQLWSELVVLKHDLVWSMFEIRIFYTKGAVQSFVTVDLYMSIVYFTLLFCHLIGMDYLGLPHKITGSRDQQSSDLLAISVQPFKYQRTHWQLIFNFKCLLVQLLYFIQY